MNQKTKHSRSEVLRFIINYKRKNDGVSPSLRQISKACGIPSISNVAYILSELQDQGKIKLQEGEYRGIIVVGGAWQYRPDGERLRKNAG